MKKYILAIETSCDETAMAIIDRDFNIICHVVNSQAEEFETIGGVVPELSSRMHVDNIFYVYNEILKRAKIKIDDIDAIAVTYGPGLVGSLLVGVNFANSLSLLYGKKIIPVNHMQGHIYSILKDNKIKYPHLSLIISGGHTELVKVIDEMTFEILGQTQDDAVGESFDKVARLLGLGYPGGPKIEKLALKGKANYKLPIPMNNETLDFSFSGLKSAAFNLSNQMKMKNIEINKNDFARSFQDTIIKSLTSKLKRAINQEKPMSVSVVGGVSCNKAIQNAMLELDGNIIFPQKELSTDNAMMIALTAVLMEKNGIETYKNVNANPTLTVEDKWQT